MALACLAGRAVSPARPASVTGNAGHAAMSLKDIRNLDHTVLLCRRMRENRALYKDTMGFPIEADLDNWVSFRTGAS